MYMAKRTEGHGREGGVGISIENGVHDVNISFLGCNFTANHAFVGGGI